MTMFIMAITYHQDKEEKYRAYHEERKDRYESKAREQGKKETAARKKV